METGIPGLREVEPLRVVDGLKEWSIPGWPDYTIREDQSVWSHKKKDKAPQRMASKILTTGGRVYVNIKDHKTLKNCHRSTERLLLYSRYGIPEERWNEVTKAGVIKDGKLVPYKEYYKDFLVIEKGRKSKRKCTLEYAVESLTVIQESADLQLKALETRDGTELLKWLVSIEEVAARLYTHNHKDWGAGRKALFHELWLIHAADAVDALVQNNRYRICMPNFVVNEVQRKIWQIFGQKKYVDTNRGLAVEYSADIHRIIENGGQLT